MGDGKSIMVTSSKDHGRSVDNWIKQERTGEQQNTAVLVFEAYSKSTVAKDLRERIDIAKITRDYNWTWRRFKTAHIHEGIRIGLEEFGKRWGIEKELGGKDE